MPIPMLSQGVQRSRSALNAADQAELDRHLRVALAAAAQDHDLEMAAALKRREKDHRVELEARDAAHASALKASAAEHAAALAEARRGA